MPVVVVRRRLGPAGIAAAVLLALLIAALIILAIYSGVCSRRRRDERVDRPIGAAVAPALAVAWGAAVADSDLRAWIHTRNTTGAWTGWVPLWVKAKTETSQFWSDAGSTVKALEMSPFYSGSNPFPLFTKGSHPWPLEDGSTDAIYALDVLGPQPVWPYTKASGGWASTLTTPDTKDKGTPAEANAHAISKSVPNYKTLNGHASMTVNPGADQKTTSWAKVSDPTIPDTIALKVCSQKHGDKVTGGDDFGFSQNMGHVSSQVFHQLSLDGQARTDAFRFRYALVGGSYSNAARVGGNGTPNLPNMSYVNDNGYFSAVRDMWMIDPTDKYVTEQRDSQTVRLPVPVPIAGMPLTTSDLIIKGLQSGKSGTSNPIPKYVTDALAGTADPTSKAKLLSGTVDPNKVVRWLAYTPERNRQAFAGTPLNSFLQRPDDVGPTAQFCFGDEGGLATTYDDAMHEDFSEGLRACRWGFTNKKNFNLTVEGATTLCNGTLGGTGQIPTVDLGTDWVQRYWETEPVVKPVLILRSVLGTGKEFVKDGFNQITSAMNASSDPNSVAKTLEVGYGCTLDKTKLTCPKTPGDATSGKGFQIMGNGNITSTRQFGSCYIEVTAKFADTSATVNAIWTYAASDGQPDAPWMPAKPDGHFGRSLWDNAEIDIELPTNAAGAVKPLKPDGTAGTIPENAFGTYAPARYTQAAGAATANGGATYQAHYAPVEYCTDPGGCQALDAMTLPNGDKVEGLLPLNLDDAQEASALVTNPDSKVLPWCCPNGTNTANFNSYSSSNNNGGGSVGYVNIPLVANPGQQDIWGDGKYHTYGIEWHTGSEGQPAAIHWYLDGVYQASTNVFVPYRMGRLVIGAITTGGHPSHWAGIPSNLTTPHPESAISDVHVVPLEEEADYYAQQSIDQALQWRMRAPNLITIPIADAVIQAAHSPAGKPLPAWAPFWGLTDLEIDDSKPTGAGVLMGYKTKIYSETDQSDSADRPTANQTPSAQADWDARIAALRAWDKPVQGVFVIPASAKGTAAFARPPLGALTLPHSAYQDPRATSPMDDPFRNLDKVRATCGISTDGADALETYAKLADKSEALTTPLLNFTAYAANLDIFSNTGWTNDTSSVPTPASGITCTSPSDCPDATDYLCENKQCVLLLCGDPESDVDQQCAKLDKDKCCGSTVKCTKGFGTAVCSDQCPENSKGTICTNGLPAYYDYPTDDFAKCSKFLDTLKKDGYGAQLSADACHPPRADADAKCATWVIESGGHPETCPGKGGGSVPDESSKAAAAGCVNLASMFSVAGSMNPDGTCHYPQPPPCQCLSSLSPGTCAATPCKANGPNDPKTCKCQCVNTSKGHSCLSVNDSPCNSKDDCVGNNCENGICKSPPCNCYSSKADGSCKTTPCAAGTGCTCKCAGGTGKEQCLVELGGLCSDKFQCVGAGDKLADCTGNPMKCTPLAPPPPAPCTCFTKADGPKCTTCASASMCSCTCDSGGQCFVNEGGPCNDTYQCKGAGDKTHQCLNNVCAKIPPANGGLEVQAWPPASLLRRTASARLPRAAADAPVQGPTGTPSALST
jgi:hypothetical protein